MGALETIDHCMTDLNIFRGKKVLVTGHTGFKGAWLAIWLDRLGADVVGLALDPDQPEGVFCASGIQNRISDYRADIRDLEAVRDIFRREEPEIVFHLAAQALVLDGYNDPVGTFQTNVQGTVHILEAIRHSPSVRAAVMVSTDKCYENKEWWYGYRENDALGGFDPYSASKGATEIAISSYRRSFFSRPGQDAAIASARAGNVIGGGDWAKNRIVPDIIRAIEKGETLQIRSPKAVRPWQHVLEPLGGYLTLASRLLEEPERAADAWNFGPRPGNLVRVEKLANDLIAHLGQGAWQDVSRPGQAHEAGLLLLDISKATHELGWQPVFSYPQTLELTADWYSSFREGDVLDLCHQQIETYHTQWRSRTEDLMVSVK